MMNDFNEDDLELVGSIKEKTALQRSHALCVSASQCHRIMGNPEQESLPPAARTYCEEIVAAQGKHYYKDVSTPAMQWGINNEPKALAEFTKLTGVYVEHTGVDDSKRLYYKDLASALPDGLLVEFGETVEVKCLDTDNHIAMIGVDIKKVAYEKYCQVQCQILCANTEYGKLVFYDPRYEEKPLHYQNFSIDQEWRTLFLKRAELARDYIKELQGESKAVQKYESFDFEITKKDIRQYLSRPQDLAALIREKAGNQVFSMETAKSRKACKSLSNQVIKSISPVEKMLGNMTIVARAKRICKAELAFRKVFEKEVREFAEEILNPLKEWEAEQERIAKEKADAIAEQERIAREAIEAEAREKQRLVDEEMESLRTEIAARDAKEQTEKDRVDQMQRSIKWFSDKPLELKNSNSKDIQAAIKHVSDQVVSNAYYHEFTDQAKREQKLALFELKELLETHLSEEKVIAEKEQAEQQAREEQIKQLAVARENARIETERREREANEAHVKAIDDEIMNAIIQLSNVESVLQAIKDGKIPHVSINY
jgi:hypothetical protein